MYHGKNTEATILGKKMERDMMNSFICALCDRRPSIEDKNQNHKQNSKLHFAPKRGCRLEGADTLMQPPF